MKYATILLVLLIAPLVAGQSIKDGKSFTRWESIGTSDDIQAEVFYAPESVKRNGDQIKLWARWNFAKGAARNLAPDWHGPTIGSFRAFLVFRCQEKKVKGLAVVGYGLDGSILAEERGDLDIDEKPGTVGHAIFTYFCERDSKAPTTAPKLKP